MLPLYQLTTMNHFDINKHTVCLHQSKATVSKATALFSYLSSRHSVSSASQIWTKILLYYQRLKNLVSYLKSRDGSSKVQPLEGV